MTRIAELFVEEGMEKGMEKGLERGRAEGRAEAVLLLLERSFGKVPPALAEMVCRQDQEGVLDGLVLAAAKASSLDEFRVQLGKAVEN